MLPLARSVTGSAGLGGCGEGGVAGSEEGALRAALSCASSSEFLLKELERGLRGGTIGRPSCALLCSLGLLLRLRPFPRIDSRSCESAFFLGGGRGLWASAISSAVGDPWMVPNNDTGLFEGALGRELGLSVIPSSFLAVFPCRAAVSWPHSSLFPLPLASCLLRLASVSFSSAGVDVLFLSLFPLIFFFSSPAAAMSEGFGLAPVAEDDERYAAGSLDDETFGTDFDPMSNEWEFQQESVSAWGAKQSHNTNTNTTNTTALLASFASNPPPYPQQINPSLAQQFAHSSALHAQASLQTPTHNAFQVFPSHLFLHRRPPPHRLSSFVSLTSPSPLALASH